MIEHREAHVNGIRLHYAASGSPDQPLMMFLHGFPEFWRAWKNQLEEFGTSHFAVAPDQRGYNLSDKPEAVEQYALPLLVTDIKELVQQLSNPAAPRRAVLVAHDWGGVVAWVVAALHPELLDRLVIINAPHPTIFSRELRENVKQQVASAYMVLFRSAAAEATLSALNFAALRTGVFRGAAFENAFDEPTCEAYLEAWSRPGALTGGLNWYRANEAKGGLAPLPPVRVPTLVIWGEKDRALLTGNLDGLDQHVPDLRVHRIPDGTHWVVHEQPALVNGLIREFITPS